MKQGLLNQRPGQETVLGAAAVFVGTVFTYVLKEKLISTFLGPKPEDKKKLRKRKK